jgi:ribosomal protein L21
MDGVKVTATVVDHGREPKIIVLRKAAQTIQAHKGHRQDLQR